MNESEPIPEPAQPERYPFWGYPDLFLFIGLALPCIALGALLVKGTVALLHLSVHKKILELLPAQFAGYAILFGFLYVLFRFQYGRPFWPSLGWVQTPIRAPSIVLRGILLALLVLLASVLLRTPDVDSPMKALLSDPTSVILIAIFGTTLGPVCEELVFQGFMQPLFVRSLGAAPGILLAAALFGLLHLQQYGFSWRHGLLITLAGTGFGWMRHKSGSTKAATVMHAAYNCTFFIGLVAQRKDLPHLW